MVADGRAFTASRGYLELCAIMAGSGISCAFSAA